MVQIKKLAVLIVLAIHLVLVSACGDDEPPATVVSGEAAEQGTAMIAAPGMDGEAIWATRANCHGAEGQGNQELGAPALANQDVWYLKRQLQLFRSGLRGTAPGDTAGSQMAAMAKALPDDAAVEAVLDYMADNLSPLVPATTIEGDIANGRDHYDMICGACHGPGGEGNEILGAPGLAGIDDWYLADQYRKFAQGMRGNDAGDKYGQQMRMMSGVLPDQETINNVVAYIQAQAAE